MKIERVCQTATCSSLSWTLTLKTEGVTALPSSSNCQRTLPCTQIKLCLSSLVGSGIIHTISLLLPSVLLPVVVQVSAEQKRGWGWGDAFVCSFAVGDYPILWNLLILASALPADFPKENSDINLSCYSSPFYLEGAPSRVN